MQITLLFTFLRATLADFLPIVKVWIDDLISPGKSKLQAALQILEIVDAELIDGKLGEKTYVERAYRIAQDVLDEDGVDEKFLSEAADLAVSMFRAQVFDRKVKS